MAIFWGVKLICPIKMHLYVDCEERSLSFYKTSTYSTKCYLISKN